MLCMNMLISLLEETQELDPNEKKIYQRDFLMQFRYHSQSMEKPQGLPAIGDIMIDQVKLLVM